MMDKKANVSALLLAQTSSLFFIAGPPLRYTYPAERRGKDQELVVKNSTKNFCVDEFHCRDNEARCQ